MEKESATTKQKDQKVINNKEEQIKGKSNDPQIKDSADLDDFDQVLNNFDETPLNLTNQDKDKDAEEDPEMMNKIKQEYENFMKEMQGGLGAMGDADMGGDQGMENLGNMLGNLMKGLTQQMGADMQGGQQFSQKFANMFNNINEDNVQDAASKLLNEFMDKSLLLEPLQQTKTNYEQFFQRCNNNSVDCSKEDRQNYQKQYEIVNKILNILENQPSNKSEMIRLFQQMQSYGNPPEGIAPQHHGFF